MLAYLLFTIFLFTANAHNSPGRLEFGDEKIVGGRTVEIEDFPYQVSVSDTDGFWCGGSIISPYHVLSAGHCARLGKPPLTVRAGSSYYFQGGSLHHVVHNVTYDNLTNYDVAVLFVKELIVFDKTRQPIELISAGDEPEPGTLGVLTGWGDTEIEKASKQLRAVDLPIIDRSTCNQLYNGTSIGLINEGQLCAGFLKGGKDSCNGDFGGPLVIDGKQVGISSMGLGCARINFPGIYADISFYSDWIKKQVALIDRPT